MQGLFGGAAAGGSDMLLEAPLVQAVQESGASAGLLYLLPPGAEYLQLTVLTGISRRIVAPLEQVRLAAGVPVADAVRDRRLVWLHGYEEVARRYPRTALVLPYPFAVAIAPITTGADVWGALVLMWPGTHPPELAQQESDALHSCCRRLGLLLEGAADSDHPVLPGREPRLIPSLRARAPAAAEALAAFDFAERLPEGCCALDLDGRITFVTAGATELVGAEAPDLLGALPWEALPWLDDPGFEDHYRAAVISRRSVSFTALRPPDRRLSFQLLPDAGGLSVLITPAVGPGSAGTPSPRQLPEPVGPSRADMLYHLLHLAATLSEAVGARDVMERVASQLMSAFDIQALALLTAEEGRLRVIGQRGFTATFMARMDATLLTEETAGVQALTSGVPGFFATSEDFARAYPHAPVPEDVAACAFLPLMAYGSPVGLLVLGYDRPFPWTPQERAALTSLAGVIAQALDRAILYDAQHQLARSLQAGLLPAALPAVPGLDVAARYLPAVRTIDVGGDFYDLVRLDGRTAAAAIGDVQGHNVNAAALMGQVRTAVHATAGAPPGEVLARTNRLLTDMDANLLTSCLYVHLDLAQHRARLATAGHLPPICRHPDGRAEVLTLPPGLLLGVDPDAEYPTIEVPFHPGSTLALYTDGLVEAPGCDIEEAMSSLADRLAQSPPGPMSVLADTLVQQSEPSAPRTDDVALLLIHHAPHETCPPDT